MLWEWMLDQALFSLSVWIQNRYVVEYITTGPTSAEHKMMTGYHNKQVKHCTSIQELNIRNVHQLLFRHRCYNVTITLVYPSNHCVNMSRN